MMYKCNCYWEDDSEQALQHLFNMCLPIPCNLIKNKAFSEDQIEFPSKQHEKFHKWEMERVNSFINGLEKQFI